MQEWNASTASSLTILTWEVLLDLLRFFGFIKGQLEMDLGNQLQVALFEQGEVDQMASRGLFQPQPVSDSVKTNLIASLFRMSLDV